MHPVQEKTRLDTRIREERLQGNAESTSRLSVWPTYQPRRSLRKSSVRGSIVA